MSHDEFLPDNTRTARRNAFLILVLGTLNALTPFTIDMYLPAFPEIAADLGIAVSRMSLTVSVYFIGFALGQILYGPLLDRFGRHRPIYLGLAVYILATFGCMTARSFDALLVFRFVSALGGSAASVGAITMVRDYFPAKDASRIFSMLMLVLSASPLLAPSIGSLIVAKVGWRPLFAALAGLAVVDVALTRFALPHAYAPDRSISLQPGPILRTFRDVLAERQFVAYTLAGSLSFAGLFVFVSGSPAVFMEGFGVSAGLFGGLFAILAGGMILGGQLNHLLLRYRDSHHVFRIALRVQIVIALVFLGGVTTFGLGLWATVVVLFAFLLCSGVTYPNAAALAIEPFTRNIGSASSLLGFLQLGIGAVAAAIVGLLDVKGPLPMAVVMATCCVAGGVVLKVAAGEREHAASRERAVVNEQGLTKDA